MTEKLYLQDIEAAYARQFDATVVDVSENTVVLDRTLFYPLGGGQHWDTGVLSGPNGEIQVSEVRGRGDVHHTVEEGHQLTVGDEVRGTIDWETRYAHMRMHTAQHLVSGWPTRCSMVFEQWATKSMPTVLVLISIPFPLMK